MNETSAVSLDPTFLSYTAADRQANAIERMATACEGILALIQIAKKEHDDGL